MEGEGGASQVNQGTLSLESGQAAAVAENEKQLEGRIRDAHTVDQDSWQQVGLLLVTSFNCAYVLSFSNLMLVPLGWAWGLTCLVVIVAFTYYANWLLLASTSSTATASSDTGTSWPSSSVHTSPFF